MNADQTRGGHEAPLGEVSSSSSDELAMAVERVSHDLRVRNLYLDEDGFYRIKVREDDLLRILSRLASQEETIRADGEAIREALSHCGAGGYLNCGKPATDKLRARLAARQEGATQ